MQSKIYFRKALNHEHKFDILHKLDNSRTSLEIYKVGLYAKHAELFTRVLRLLPKNVIHAVLREIVSFHVLVVSHTILNSKVMCI